MSGRSGRGATTAYPQIASVVHCGAIEKAGAAPALFIPGESHLFHVGHPTREQRSTESFDRSDAVVVAGPGSDKFETQPTHDGAITLTNASAAKEIQREYASNPRTPASTDLAPREIAQPLTQEVDHP